jgi:hypothetical protein
MDYLPENASDAQRAADAALNSVMSDPDHLYWRPDAPGHLQAVEHVAELHRARLGDDNRGLLAFREDGEAGPPPVVEGPSPALGWDSVPGTAPPSWTGAQAEQAATAAAALGLSPADTALSFSLLDMPVPPEEAELDLDQLWGSDLEANVRLVNGLLSRLQAIDPGLYARALPFVQRNASICNHVLALARRLARR